MTRRLFIAAAATLALAIPAFATNPYGQPIAQPHCETRQVTTWQTVVTWETRREPYQQEFTLEDDCGRTYTVSRTLYRDVRVPVKKMVPVTKMVRVGY